MAEPGLIDFSLLGKLPDAFAKGEERRQQSEYEDLLRKAAQKGGPVDYGDLVKQAMAAGYTPGIEMAAKLKQAEAMNQYHLGTLAETRRQHDILAGQAMRPTIHWNPPDPWNPSAAPTGIMITHDKNGNIIDQRVITGGPGGAAPQPQQPQQKGPADYWSKIPTQGLPGAGALGPRSDLEQPGGPALAQAPGPFPASPSDELIARAQGQGPQPEPPGAQFAQAGGPPIPPPQPQPAPSWLGAAQAPAAKLPQQQEQEAPNPLSREQRGTLRYTPPLGPFNEEILASQPGQVQGIIRGLVTGRVNPMSIPAKLRPQVEGLAQLYSNGNYDQTFYNRRQRTLNAFGGGAGAIQGRTLQAIGNLVDHFDTAREIIDKLNNGQVPAANALWNKIREITGYQAELPGNLKAAAPIITAELMKVVAGAGTGGVGERAENEMRLFSANANPKVAYGAIDTAQKLMGGQIRALEQMYENNTYNTDFRNRLSPGARKIMDKLDAAHTEQPTTAPAAEQKRTKTGVPYTIEP